MRPSTRGDDEKADIAVQMVRFEAALDRFEQAVADAYQDARTALVKRHRRIVEEWAEYRAALQIATEGIDHIRRSQQNFSSPNEYE